MPTNYAQEIKSRINAYPEGTVFSGSEFADIAETSTRRQILKRLSDEGMIRRVIDGLYEKPKYSDLLQEYIATSPENVALALARCYHWTIAPCGNTALNMLGLSTQVTATWTFISDGPYRDFDLGITKLQFKHRTNKEISGLSPTTALVIQALKALGKGNVTDAHIATISKRLTSEEKNALLLEGKEATGWVYETIKKICGGSQK